MIKSRSVSKKRLIGRIELKTPCVVKIERSSIPVRYVIISFITIVLVVVTTTPLSILVLTPMIYALIPKRVHIIERNEKRVTIRGLRVSKSDVSLVCSKFRWES